MGRCWDSTVDVDSDAQARGDTVLAEFGQQRGEGRSRVDIRRHELFHLQRPVMHLVAESKDEGEVVVQLLCRCSGEEDAGAEAASEPVREQSRLAALQVGLQSVGPRKPRSGKTQFQPAHFAQEVLWVVELELAPLPPQDALVGVHQCQVSRFLGVEAPRSFLESASGVPTGVSAVCPDKFALSKVASRGRRWHSHRESWKVGAYLRQRVGEHRLDLLERTAQLRPLAFRVLHGGHDALQAVHA